MKWILTAVALVMLATSAHAETRLLFLPQPGGTGTLTAVWDPNPPSTTGYIVYIGTQSGVYPTAVDVHNVTSYMFPIGTNTAYYVAVLAYDTAGLRSGLSNEASWAQDPAPPPCVQTVVGPASIASGASSGQVTITSSSTCSPWSIVFSQAWLRTVPFSGTGNLTLAFTADPNPTQVTRSTTLSIANASLTITQAAAPPPPPPPSTLPCDIAVPRITPGGFTDRFKLGSYGRIQINDLDWTAEIGDRRIAWIETQLGTQPPQRITNPDVIATIPGQYLTYRSTVKSGGGTFNLVVRAGDNLGCIGVTGAPRPVRVN
jgi:hypothetical protein